MTTPSGSRFDLRPFIAIWETTQSCDLVCKHCRASARPERDPRELSTDEGRAVLDQLAAAEVPLVVLTGGDPAKRDDLVELVRHGRAVGLAMGLTPSPTPLVTRELLVSLADAGLSRLAISIDGPNAESHDEMRGRAGSFAESLRILEVARDLDIPTQINTTVHAGNVDQLAAMSEVVRALGAILWSVFYVVPTGRAGQSMMPSAERVERSLEELADIASEAPYWVKTTAAPHYRRVLAQRHRGEVPGVHGKRSLRVNDGRGFMFVSHVGEVFPSGFLPIPCGNVRDRNPIEIYRHHSVFQTLRDVEELEGKCGACEFRSACGGSRARAYALSGHMMAEDPLCAFVPEGYEAPKRVHLPAIA